MSTPSSPPSFDNFFNAQRHTSDRHSSSNSYSQAPTPASYDGPLNGPLVEEPKSLIDPNAPLNHRNAPKRRGSSLLRLESLPFDPESSTLIATAPLRGSSPVPKPNGRPALQPIGQI